MERALPVSPRKGALRKNALASDIAEAFPGTPRRTGPRVLHVLGMSSLYATALRNRVPPWRSAANRWRGPGGGVDATGVDLLGADVC